MYYRVRKSRIDPKIGILSPIKTLDGIESDFLQKFSIGFLHFTEIIIIIADGRSVIKAGKKTTHAAR